MSGTQGVHCIAFAGQERIAEGALAGVAMAVKEYLDASPQAQVLIFDSETSHPIEVDFRGTAEEVLERIPREEVERGPEKPRGPGRPKLGVVAREVTLLPRHWEWLSVQPGGASVALRKLVEEARRTNSGKDCVRRAQEAAYRFLSAMAGNLPDFEEATRALFAGEKGRFDGLVASWPAGIRDHAMKLAARAMSGESGGAVQ